MKIAIGNDHTAVALKAQVIANIENHGHYAIDCGTDTTDKVDYPIYAERVARKVLAGEADCGILICGTGLGMSIAANKIDGIRAAACSEPYSAQMARQHNNANVITFGARVVGPEMAFMIVNAYLDAHYEPRHQARLDMVARLEKGEPLE